MTTTVAVFLSTGNQGSSVVRALAEQYGKSITIRAFTRDPESESTKAAFAAYTDKSNIVPVKVDVHDADSLRQGLKGVNIVFAVTLTPWPGAPDNEVADGKLAIQIAQEEGVDLYVFSTLSSLSELSDGKYTKMTNFENKAEIFKALQESKLKYVGLEPGFFCENYTSYHIIKKAADEDGFEINWPVQRPDVKVGHSFIHQDMGQSVKAVVKAHLENAGPEVFGKKWFAVGYEASLEDVGKLLTERTGKAVRYITPPEAMTEGFTQMNQFMNDGGHYSTSELPVPELVRLGAKFSTLEQYVDNLLIPHLNKA